MDDDSQQDICRVCRSEGSHERPLFYPCICTGSIKYIHQECLIQWLRYSRKEYCELCNHRFSFTPIYSPDMPKRLPIADILSGLLGSVATAVRFWFHYTLVAFAWLGIVPLTACRIYRCLFAGSVNSILSLPLDMLSTENLLSDILQGCLVVTCTLCAFISLVWLREQILHGGGPDWLEQEAAAHEEDGGAPVGPAADADEAEPPFEDAADEPGGGGGAGGGGGGGGGADGGADWNGFADGERAAAGADDNNWNPMDWDRAAEELTWERLLGLDGSLVFLEHVFWVVSLNTLFILVFAFCPYHIGHFAIMGFRVQDMVMSSHFEGLLTTLVGYCIIGVMFVLLHTFASLLSMLRAKRILGVCYVVVKVSMLAVVEIGVFPLVCGWWLDVCSLTLLDTSLQDRQKAFKLAPGSCMFLHWLVGMIYVFYFASFILLLREVLRPGVLWFLRNLNDPDFNPIQEMIHLPVLRHTRRFIASVIIFGTTVLLMLWLPVRFIQYCWPRFLPYNVALVNEGPVVEPSLQILLLQVFLPALLEQGHTKVWLKNLVRWWCVAVAWVTDLRSYLLGDVALNEQEDDIERGNYDGPLPAPPPLAPAAPRVEPNGAAGGAAGLGGGLGAAHQALIMHDAPVGFQPYKRPQWMTVRIGCLLVLMCLTLLVSSVLMLTVPVRVGRCLLSLWVSDGPAHELYTAACGLYATWLLVRLAVLAASWLPLGWTGVCARLRHWAAAALRALVAFVVLVGVIPLCYGLLLEVVVIVPIRVPLNQTPVFFVFQDWALGVLYTKITCAITMMGPNWWLKAALEQVYLNGLRNLQLRAVLLELALPLVVLLGLALAVPYVLVHSFAPLFLARSGSLYMVQRQIYPCLVIASSLLTMLVFQYHQFKKLYEHIKNDKYLVGRRLVNYDPQRQESRAPPAADEVR
ncbi:E3 ubiquitin-protein ligase MARCHF6-like [Pollicipes pollicipes]|uniref:E3 ubiquitin-protein ligase MARCHF6-like n=1 Tax=Pollicipes pollicipes TaxID=41117 RepID=UPI00188562BB|nr:E3 ubiquitin-protein ligase MARCHF6-like [Pollicipes pollicipes]XP_037085051.1 E3 ubiquitin-protein ligase MARCHF6-like [Pollicipes pollicipes]XP_037085052.1 E3 ubiquitin-protein ligase MARCHF6-like [Pollicipes pollicipes]